MFNFQEYYQLHKEEFRKKYTDNREKCIKAALDRYERKKDLIRKQRSEYYLKNKDKFKANKAKFDALHPERTPEYMRNYMRLYRERNTEHLRNYMRNYMRLYHERKRKMAQEPTDVVKVLKNIS